MKITFLGTCSGTEPQPGRRHCSFVIEHHEAVYWFDAGESCSYNAHLAGINLLSTEAVFISHTHMDHIGGLPNLLWNIRKINGITPNPERRISGKTIGVFLPDLAVWQGITQLLRGTEGGFEIDFNLNATLCRDGDLYQNNGFQVTALHNLHLGTPAPGDPWKSFCYLIEADGKRIVFSGDVASIDDVAPLLDNCDLFLMETGHHKVEDVCNYLKKSGKNFGKLGFIHHGRAILGDVNKEREKARRILGDQVFITEDGDVLDNKLDPVALQV